jgi:pyruvate dehydrogenase E1 component
MRAALLAQEELASRWGVAADVWSVTSWKMLREEALEAERWNRLHPTESPRVPYVTQQLESAEGPVVAVTDYVKSVADQIARFVPAPFVPLGTDGYGLSDTREALRRHFEVDHAHVVVAALDGLAQLGEVMGELVDEAIARYAVDPEAPDPRRM